MLNAKDFICLFRAWAELMRREKDELVRLDSVGGDGDLGLAMMDGFNAIEQTQADSSETDIGKLLYAAGKTMSEAASSSLGTLLAFGFMSAGRALKGKSELHDEELLLFFHAFEEAIQTRGGAKMGEKTFLDAFDPARCSLDNDSFEGGLYGPLRDAALAAAQGAERTRDMVARHGRIAVRGDASRGIIDPGAVVAALMINTMAETFSGK